MSAKNKISSLGKKAVLLIFFVCFVSARLWSQTGTVQLPTIIPPSPLAENMMRYGEIPVDYSTGVPNISIPLFTVEGRKLKIPISISYHGSGIKVEDVPSDVGLGWVLNCGGMIARTVNEIPDEQRTAQRTFASAQKLLDSVSTGVWENLQPSHLSYENITLFYNYFSDAFKYEDPLSDRYYYILPNGISGAFAHNYPSGDTTITLPYRPWKINSSVNDSIIIRDEDGTVYLFKPFVNQTDVYNEWRLTKMVSADGTDSISFYYHYADAQATSANLSMTVMSSKLVYTSSGAVNPTNPSITYNGIVSPSPLTDFAEPLLDSVISSQAVVKFIYASRTDFNTLMRLSKIVVSPIGSPANILREIDFTPEYFGSTSQSQRLGLQSLSVSASSIAPQVYTFSYNSTALPPYPAKMASPTYSEDFWGYYNGYNSSGQIPQDVLAGTPYASSYGGNREPDITGNYSEACMLNSIKYPTGGSTVFQFERNSIGGVNVNSLNRTQYVGGFRIKSITNYNADSNVADVKTYEYADAQACTFNRYYFEGYNTLQSYTAAGDESIYGSFYTYSDTSYFSNPLLPLEVAPGLPIMYEAVTEYEGTPTNNSGKTVYTYEPPYSPSDFMDNPEHPNQWELPFFYYSYQYDKGNYLPQMTSKTVYSYDENHYHLVSKENYTYTDLFAKEFETGIKLTQTTTFGGDAVNDPGELYDPYFSPYIVSRPDHTPDAYANSIIAIDAKAYQQATLLTNSQTYTYNPQDSCKYLLTSTDYIYNQTNLKLQQKTTYSSKGALLKTSYKYPSDFAAQSPYNMMASQNILSPVVEETDYNGSAPVSDIKTNYQNWGNSIYEPANVQIAIGSSQPETRLTYDAYDTKGNLLSVSKTNDAKTVYLWGYNSQYPVAKVIGSEYATVSSKVTQSILDNGTDAQIQQQLANLRNAFSNNPLVQVFTYTYKPLIGMSTATDPQGSMTYYEYDGLGRLSLVLDKDQNVVKKYAYGYAGQTENDNSIFYISQQSQSFTRNNCLPGTAGTTVTYTAVENSFISQADADAKALADVATNGQNYANTYGICGTLVSVTANNSASSGCYGVEFDNSSAGVDLFFDLSSGYSVLGSLPSGTYDYIGFYNAGGCSGQTFSVGCDGITTSNTSGYFPNATFNHSCSISIQ